MCVIYLSTYQVTGRACFVRCRIDCPTCSCVHHYRVEEADGGRQWLLGTCLKCAYARYFKAWIDPFENLEAGDYAHELIFGMARGNEVND